MFLTKNFFLTILILSSPFAFSSQVPLTPLEKAKLIQYICQSPQGSCASYGLFSIADENSELEVIYDSCSNTGIGNDSHECYKRAQHTSKHPTYRKIVKKCSQEYDRDAAWEWISWYNCIEDKLDVIFK